MRKTLIVVCFVLSSAIIMTATVGTGSRLTSPSTIPSVECDVGTGYRAKGKAVRTVTASADVDTCDRLYASAIKYDRDMAWQQTYDTSKLFIEHCAFRPASWRAFPFINQATEGLSATLGYESYLRSQSWLKSVLYLNTTDPEYFCVCVESISQTLYVPDTSRQAVSHGTNRQLAVIQWLIQHTSCDTAVLRGEYVQGRLSQLQSWLNDTTVALDTTLPSMHDLGLDSILNLHLGVPLAKSSFASELETFSISQNPFISKSTLLVELDRMTYLKAEVYDELGRMIVGDGSGHSFDPGKHQIPIDLTGFPSGAYYLRISLGDGETRTIKMVKKE